MPALTRWLDERLYPDYADNWDDERLREAAFKYIRPDMTLLDLGAGAGRIKQMNFRGLVSRVAGIDPDPRVRQNPHLDEAVEGFADNLPFASNSFDIVICDNVLEHLNEPELVLREVARVLKPGGVFLAKTPNRTHYMSLIARFTPTAFHRYVNRLRGRPVEDTFPTRYRINSAAAIRHYAERSGFRVEAIQLIEGRPEYLRFNTLAYLAGWLYELAVNSTELLARFRIVLLIVLRKAESH
jgi:ubiquinone/menaquinone biosynthesis C-methylase UbiE